MNRGIVRVSNFRLNPWWWTEQEEEKERKRETKRKKRRDSPLFFADLSNVYYQSIVSPAVVVSVGKRGR